MAEVSPYDDTPQQWLGRINRAEVAGMVDKWYEMDPETEGVLFDGTEIKIGMVILPENPDMRVDVREEFSDKDLYRAHRTNRWFRVVRLQRVGSVVLLLAEYEDGMQTKLEIAITESWLFKLASVGVVPGKMEVLEVSVDLFSPAQVDRVAQIQDDIINGAVENLERKRRLHSVDVQAFKQEREGTWPPKNQGGDIPSRPRSSTS